MGAHTRFLRCESYHNLSGKILQVEREERCTETEREREGLFQPGSVTLSLMEKSQMVCMTDEIKK